VAYCHEHFRSEWASEAHWETPCVACEFAVCANQAHSPWGPHDGPRYQPQQPGPGMKVKPRCMLLACMPCLFARMTPALCINRALCLADIDIWASSQVLGSAAIHAVSESFHAPCLSAMQTGLYSNRFRSEFSGHAILRRDLAAHLKSSVCHAGPRMHSMRGARWMACPLMGAVGRSTTPQRCSYLASSGPSIGFCHASLR
jgi:hypothetical protein